MKHFWHFPIKYNIHIYGEIAVLFGKLESILFLMIVVFLVKKLIKLSARSSVEVKCGRSTFELLHIRF